MLHGNGKIGAESPKPPPPPPLFKLSCACCQVEAEASTAVHYEKHCCTQSSNRASWTSYPKLKRSLSLEIPHFPARRLMASPTAMGRMSGGQLGLFFFKATRLPPARNLAACTGTLPEISKLTTSLSDRELKGNLCCFYQVLIIINSFT